MQWHRIHVVFVLNSQKASTFSLFRASESVLIGPFFALSRSKQGLRGLFARLNWPQPFDKFAISVIEEPAAAADSSGNYVRESQVSLLPGKGDIG
jgi:hypothetical protein